MYIRNISDMGKTYNCTPLVGKWIQEKNFPILSILDGRYYFSDTELLREVISNIPVWMKILNMF